MSHYEYDDEYKQRCHIPKTCEDPYCWPDDALDCLGCPYNGLQIDDE